MPQEARADGLHLPSRSRLRGTSGRTAAAQLAGRGYGVPTAGPDGLWSRYVRRPLRQPEPSAPAGREARALAARRSARSGARRRRALEASFFRSALLLALCAAPSASAGAVFGVRLQASASHGLTAPQGTRFGLGPDLRLSAVWQAAETVDVRLELGAGLWPSTERDASGRPSALFSTGAAVRLRQPLTPERRFAFWIDAGASYVRSGPFGGLGLAVAAGGSISLLPSGTLLLGPALRIDSVFLLGEASRRVAVPTLFASLGVELEYRFSELGGAGKRGEERGGTRSPRPPSAAQAGRDGAPPVVKVEPRGCGAGSPPRSAGCPDGDGDGISDAEDLCPAEPGPSADGGCPAVRPFEIVESEVVIRQRVRFAPGNSRLTGAAHATVLDVAATLAANPEACVRIAAYAGAASPARRALALQRERMKAVVLVLRSRGVAAARISTVGSPSLAVDPRDEAHSPGDVAILSSPCEPPS